MEKLISDRCINPKDIVLDIKSFLGDYFIAGIDCDGDGILLNFDNGQQFLLSVEEK